MNPAEQKLKAAMEANKKRILDHPAPVEKYKMSCMIGATNRYICIYDGAENKVAQLTSTPHLRKIMKGRLSIAVKGKIIDETFELIKTLV